MLLPQHLDAVRGRLLSPGGVEPELLKAASNLLDRYETLNRRSNDPDLSLLYRDFGELTWDDDFGGLSPEDQDRALQLQWRIRETQSDFHAIRRTSYSLVAISHLLRESTRQDVLSDLECSRWNETHEVLTRWMWCVEQRRARTKGLAFTRPFLCEVGAAEGRQTLDREFYTALQFLPLYRKETNRKLLLTAYRGDTNQSPDFDVKDEEGTVLGLEVTEAPLDTSSVFEEKQREAVVKHLHSVFCEWPVSLSIWVRPRWSTLANRLPMLDSWLDRVRSGDVRALLSMEDRRFVNMDLSGPSDRGLEVRIEPSDSFSILDISGSDGSGRGFAGNEVEEHVKQAVRARVTKKLRCPRPVTAPCLLVIYENTRLPSVDFAVVRADLAGQFASGEEAGFAEFWIMDHTHAVRLR